MKGYTTQQKIKIAGILSKTNPQSLPYVLDVLGIKQKVDIMSLKPPRAVCATITDFITAIEDIEGKISKEVYVAYREYYTGRQVASLTHIEFSRQVNRAFDYRSAVKRISGTTSRIFTK